MMFVEKLWIRIKGELLALKEDFSVSEDLRTKAGRLLDRVQERVVRGQPDPTVIGTEDHVPHQTRVRDAPRGTRTDTDSLEQEWRDIAQDRDRQKKASDQESNAPAPNPRRLG